MCVSDRHRTWLSHSWNRFRQRCREAGKYLMVWTVNEPAYMMEVCRSVATLLFVEGNDVHRRHDGVLEASSPT